MDHKCDKEKIIAKALEHAHEANTKAITAMGEVKSAKETIASLENSLNFKIDTLKDNMNGGFRRLEKVFSDSQEGIKQHMAESIPVRTEVEDLKEFKKDFEENYEKPLENRVILKKAAVLLVQFILVCGALATSLWAIERFIKQ